MGLGGLVQDLGWDEGSIYKPPLSNPAHSHPQHPLFSRHPSDLQSTLETFLLTYEPTLGTRHNHEDKGVWN